MDMMRVSRSFVRSLAFANDIIRECGSFLRPSRLYIYIYEPGLFIFFLPLFGVFGGALIIKCRDVRSLRYFARAYLIGKLDSAGTS